MASCFYKFHELLVKIKQFKLHILCFTGIFLTEPSHMQCGTPLSSSQKGLISIFEKRFKDLYFSFFSECKWTDYVQMKISWSMPLIFPNSHANLFFLKLQGPSSFLSHKGGVITRIFKIKYHNDKYCNLNKSRAMNFGIGLGYTHLQHFMIWTGEIIFCISMSLTVSALNLAALMLHIFSIKWHQWSIIINNNLTLKIIEDSVQKFPVHTKRKKGDQWTKLPKLGLVEVTATNNKIDRFPNFKICRMHTMNPRCMYLHLDVHQWTTIWINIAMYLKLTIAPVNISKTYILSWTTLKEA